MKDHKYKLATLVLSTGILLSACGGGEEAEAPEEQTEDTTVEETENGTTEDGGSTDDSSGESTEGDTTEDSGSADDSSSEDTGSTDDTESSGSEGGTAVLDQLGSTPEEAVSTAQESFDGELAELELDEENGDWVYKVNLENESEEYETTLSANDLSVVNEETETNDDNDTEDQFAYGDAIPHDEAVQTAIDEAGGELEGWTLDKDDGQLEYEVELVNAESGKDVDVTINAESGEVIEIDD